MPILNWLNKEQAVTTAKSCDYRLLEEVPNLSYGDSDSENLLIQGDNLEALKALIPFYAGKVKCIFIDPPYNTKSAFEHYDDNLEHSKWLSLMYPRLELLRELLSEEGSIWITIDEDEQAYLRVVCDEVFGRSKFVATNIWQKRYAPDVRKAISDAHEYLLCYAMNPRSFKETRNLLPLTDAQTKQFHNPDKDQRGPWKASDFTAPGFRPNQMYEITLPSGRVVTPPGGRCWRVTKEGFEKFIAEEKMYYGPKGDSLPSAKRFLSEMPGMVPWTWWPHTDAGHSQEGKKENQVLFGSDNTFATPKPERLLQRIIHIASNEGDLVLDSFLGSGTTAAVAHKMSRRYIGIEIGDHAETHCQPRLKMVVDGEEGGISKAVDWKGGGGFKFIRLGHTVFDEYGSLNTDIKFTTLAAHVWYLETKQPMINKKRSAYLGVHGETAYYLLYNGILGDRRPDGGNVLTSKIIKVLPSFGEHLKLNRTIVIYGESTRLGEARLRQENVVFKQIPYDVGAL